MKSTKINLTQTGAKRHCTCTCSKVDLAKLENEYRAPVQRPPETDTNPHNFKTGGILFEKSPCCGATVTSTTGGIITKICSACGKAIKPMLFR